MTDSPFEPDNLPIDTIATTTASLLALEYPTPHNRAHDAPPEPDRSSEKTAIENALRKKVSRTTHNDLSDLETMLTCQVQLLHHIFTHSAKKYAASPMIDNSRHHSNVALKSQHYCRMTIAAINALKSKDVPTPKRKKSNNELLRGEMPYAPMDRGRTPTSAEVDPWLAAMEEELWR